MVDLITSISASIEIVQKLRELAKKVDEADFKMLLADLMSELGDAKLQAANLKIELASATERIGELERKASRSTQNDPELHDGAYIFGDPKRHYCTGCFDSRGQKILLNQLSGPFTVFGKWQCPTCDKTFGSSG